MDSRLRGNDGCWAPAFAGATSNKKASTRVGRIDALRVVVVRTYFVISSSSTSKISVEFGPIVWP
ncbi:MAG: hypothetical protein RIR53_1862 [Bacteroidota bacterium]